MDHICPACIFKTVALQQVHALLSGEYSVDLGILIVYSIKSSVSVLLDCALIPDSRIVSIALLIVLRKIRMSFITALLFPLTREGFGVELR